MFIYHDVNSHTRYYVFMNVCYIMIIEENTTKTFVDSHINNGYFSVADRSAKPDECLSILKRSDTFSLQ